MTSKWASGLLVTALGGRSHSRISQAASTRGRRRASPPARSSAANGRPGRDTQPLPQGADDQKCIVYSAAPLVSGLGQVSLSFTAWQTYFGNCVRLAVVDGSIVTSRQGALRFAGAKTGCAGTGSEGILKGQVPVAVTGGDGDFADASGQETLTLLSVSGAGTGVARRATGEIVLTLDLPHGDFDVAPPTITGAVSKHVRASKQATHVRVVYRVAAQDAIDGPVPVACRPPSGSRFRVGPTKVTCSAKDSSANTTTARFTVTVTRAER